jgi:hypothetical protein
MVAELGKLLQSSGARVPAERVKKVVQQPAALMIRGLCAAAAALETDDPQAAQERTNELLQAYADLEEAVSTKTAAGRPKAPSDLEEASRRLYRQVRRTGQPGSSPSDDASAEETVRRVKNRLPTLGVHPKVAEAVRTAGSEDQFVAVARKLPRKKRHGSKKKGRRRGPKKRNGGQS